MNEIILILLVLLMIVIIVLQFASFKGLNHTNNPKLDELFSQQNNNYDRLIKDFNELKLDTLKESSNNHLGQVRAINDFQEKMLKELNENFTKVNDLMKVKLLDINKELNEQLDKNFAKTNNAFSEMIGRLAKIDEAQKKIESLSTNIVSLQDILSDKKSRGYFGEVQLNNIIKSIFGEKNDHYKIQAKLSNGSIVDALIKVPEPVGNIAIDSKFPLESYNRLMDEKTSLDLKNNAIKQFKSDIKKHVDTISSKYIIAPETTNSAIMFLPAEAIFAEINAYHPDLIDYANNRRVWISSPTTLMATLTSIQVIVQNLEQSKYAKVIQEHLMKLNDDFMRYSRRWDALSKHLDTVSNDAKDIHVSTKKITNQFEKISNVNFEESGGDYLE